jgi:hypothetical protein
MGYNFPNSPTVDQTYGNYVWDGEKWKLHLPVGTGALTEAEKTRARQNIYAAPFDAMAYNGMQINGSMEVSQERGTAGISINNEYLCDGWKTIKNGTMVLTGQAVNAPGYFQGFQNLLHLITTTAQPALGAGDYVSARAYIEGYRVSRLEWGSAAAKPLTIGFWSSHNRTGIHSVALHNSGFNRNYTTTYTQNVSGVPQYNVITIPGDTTGTWDKANGPGLVIEFSAACGTTYTAPTANTWSTTTYLAAPGQVNGVAATSDVFRITGVVVLPGIEAPSAERSPLIMRPYDQELITCQRYYERRDGGGYFFAINNSIFRIIDQNFKVIKRAVPTITLVGASSNGTWAGGQPVLDHATTYNFAYSGHVGAADQLSSYVSWIADARL